MGQPRAWPGRYASSANSTRRVSRMTGVGIGRRHSEDAQRPQELPTTYGLKGHLEIAPNPGDSGPFLAFTPEFPDPPAL
jgi:hypothetical protein